jgi:hypothetical protein
MNILHHIIFEYSIALLLHAKDENLRKWLNMWSKAKNGLVQPSMQGRTSPFFVLRKHEISRDFARKQKKNEGSL